VSSKTPVQRIKVAGEYYILMPYEEYLSLAKASKTLSSSFPDTVDAPELDGRPPEFEDGRSALRVWRNFRGMTANELAHECGCSPSMVTQVEIGQRRGAPALWRAFADALGVTVDDILPEKEIGTA
jgi:DNA-binding XRE family transcriptional regulator